MNYAKMIAARLVELGVVGVDVNAVEALMRLENPTLDGLARARFEHEVDVAVELVQTDPAAAHAIAESMGF